MLDNELVIVIPAYEPNTLMTDLIKDLNQYFHHFHILIVNDGSLHADETFALASTMDNVTIIAHDVNKGKGAALKTAYKYIQSMDDSHHIIVTCDADGQHRPEDIYKVATYYDEHKDGVVLGSRQFEEKVPLRSRFGNDSTKVLYRLINRKALSDNQTGLRAFGSELIPFMIDIAGDRYEYEMNVLMECPRKNIKISEVKIQTVYINNNSSSHFRPVRDFLRICKEILKYAIPSVISLIINIIFFIITFQLLKDNSMDERLKIFICAVVGCFFAFLFNMIIQALGIFYGNAHIFKSKKRVLQYFAISVVTIIIQSGFIFGMYVLVEDYTAAKAWGDVDYIAAVAVVNYLLAPKPKVQ